MAQEALLRAWRSLSSYKGQSRFSTWLYRITTNVCLDELRKRKNNQNMSIQEMEESGMETVDPAETPEPARARGQLRQERQSASGTRNEEQRAALVRRAVQGLPYEQIAEILNLNLNTVKSRISRARGALRAILTGKTELSGKRHV